MTEYLSENYRPKPLFRNVNPIQQNINKVSFKNTRKLINETYQALSPEDKNIIISCIKHELYCGEEPSDIIYGKDRVTLKILNPDDRKEVLEAIKNGAKNEKETERANKLERLLINGGEDEKPEEENEENDY